MKTKFFKVFKRFNHSPKTFLEYLNVLNNKANLKDPNLNDIDVSNLEKIGKFFLFNFFKANDFYVDEWDVSNVLDFSYCFSTCKNFNCDLSQWDVSNAENLNGMFFYCSNFNKSVNHFNIYNSTNNVEFFAGCLKFNKELYNFVFNPRADSLRSFFVKCLEFNQNISMWDVSNVVDFFQMFENTKKFKQDLRNWNVSKATNFAYVFSKSLMMKYPELMPEKFRKYYDKK